MEYLIGFVGVKEFYLCYGTQDLKSAVDVAIDEYTSSKPVTRPVRIISKPSCIGCKSYKDCYKFEVYKVPSEVQLNCKFKQIVVETNKLSELEELMKTLE